MLILGCDSQGKCLISMKALGDSPHFNPSYNFIGYLQLKLQAFKGARWSDSKNDTSARTFCNGLELDNATGLINICFISMEAFGHYAHFDTSYNVIR